MTTLIFRLFALCTIALVVSTGCGDAADDDSGNSSKYAIPSGAQDIMSDEDLAHFQEQGFEIHEGSNPPDIQGTYRMADSTVTYDESGEYTGRSLYTYEWTFADQQDDQVQVSYQSEGGDEMSGAGGFISGDANCFTVISRLEGVSGENCLIHRVHMFSGCVVANGIDDFQTAYHTRNLGQSADSDADQCPAEDGPRRMSVEHDGLIDRI